MLFLSPLQSDGKPIAICVFALFVRLVASQKTCPDGSLCDTGDTCCKLRSGKYSCCPLPNAVCCEDQEHCCPSRYRCDNETDACKPSAHVEALRSQALSNTNEQPRNDYVQCSLSDNAVCPAGHTCCMTTPTKKTTNYSCCPFRNAVCCADGKHCCPAQSTCQPTTGRCSYDDAAEAPEKATHETIPTTSRKAVPAECRDEVCTTSFSRNTIRTCPPGYYQCSNPVYCCPDDFLCTFTGACVPKPHVVTKTVAEFQYGN
ncbi:progranulin [Rhipicephalus sanguineus]|uniref:progranulin n=1 Tax=Rhipicephalus sanguineus TaxID=34632 RepID=UPI0018949EB8|nr:progranulin [Rhipicephalus sanguineus]